MERKQGIAAGLVKAILWVYSSATFLLIVYLIYNSLRTKQDFLQNTLGVPAEFTLENYKTIIVNDSFFRYFLNSVLILVFSLALLVMLSSLAAYGIARYSFKFRQAMRVFFLVGMMFPIQLGIVPIYLLMKNIGLVNSLLSVILVTASGISMPVFMLTNFFSQLPNEVYEAARIDGANEWQAFARIMFPMASPAIMSVCVTVSVQIWNQFFLPLIFLQSDTRKTVPLLVTKYTKNLLMNIDKALATSVLATVPILIIFIIFSNRIIEGVTEGAVKG